MNDLACASAPVTLSVFERDWQVMFLTLLRLSAEIVRERSSATYCLTYRSALEQMVRYRSGGGRVPCWLLRDE